MRSLVLTRPVSCWMHVDVLCKRFGTLRRPDGAKGAHERLLHVIYIDLGWLDTTSFLSHKLCHLQIITSQQDRLMLETKDQKFSKYNTASWWLQLRYLSIPETVNYLGRHEDPLIVSVIWSSRITKSSHCLEIRFAAIEWALQSVEAQAFPSIPRSTSHGMCLKYWLPTLCGFGKLMDTASIRTVSVTV